MPAKVKVRILAGRNLPVMDKSSDASDAFVEVKLGNTTYKTEVYRRSLNPFWNSEWFRFEVSDQELQDEPLQIRIMDYDTYSANDAIGKVYINLNPLLLNPGRSMNGWLPIYDTLHGIRGEINCMVKVNLFVDNNRFRHSSCGVRFFFSDIPNGYKCDAILGFVDELLVNDDPEYQWIDKIRTPRASNEARQTLFTKLSGEVQRKLGLKAEVFGGNAVIGYQQSFDLEGSSGIVGRGIGTAVVLSKIGHQYESVISPLSLCNFNIPYPYFSTYNNQAITRSASHFFPSQKAVQPQAERHLVHSLSADYFYEVPSKPQPKKLSNALDSAPLVKTNNNAIASLDDTSDLETFVSLQSFDDDATDVDTDDENDTYDQANADSSSNGQLNQGPINNNSKRLMFAALSANTRTNDPLKHSRSFKLSKSTSSFLNKLIPSNETTNLVVQKLVDHVKKPVLSQATNLKLIRKLSYRKGNASGPKIAIPIQVDNEPTFHASKLGRTGEDLQHHHQSGSSSSWSQQRSSTSPSTQSQSLDSSNVSNQQQLQPPISAATASLSKKRKEKMLTPSAIIDDALSIIEEKLDDDDGCTLKPTGGADQSPRGRLLSNSSNRSKQFVRTKEVDLSGEHDLPATTSTSPAANQLTRQKRVSVSSVDSEDIDENIASDTLSTSTLDAKTSPLPTTASELVESTSSPSASMLTDETIKEKEVSPRAKSKGGTSAPRRETSKSLKSRRSNATDSINAQQSKQDAENVPPTGSNSVEQNDIGRTAVASPEAASSRRKHSLRHTVTSNSIVPKSTQNPNFIQSVKVVKAQQHLLQNIIKHQNQNLVVSSMHKAKNAFMYPNRIHQSEYPFVTLKRYPEGLIQCTGGVVSAHSVKLLNHSINDEESETRDIWWTELRKEIRSHTKSLNCNTILGYCETSKVLGDVCILSARGTAAIMKPIEVTNEQQLSLSLGHSQRHQQTSGNALKVPRSNASPAPASHSSMPPHYRNESPNAQQQQQPKTNQLESGEQSQSQARSGAASLDGSADQQAQLIDCTFCHTPLVCVESINSLANCSICKSNKVPDVLLLTIEPPKNLNIVSSCALVQARVCRIKRDSHGEASAKEIGDALPFLEYELHRQLFSKLKFKGMNCLFNLSIDISIGENMLTGLATGTGCFVLGLPTPEVPQISAGKGIKATKLNEIRKLISLSAIKNRQILGLDQIELQLANYHQQTGSVGDNLSDNDDGDQADDVNGTEKNDQRTISLSKQATPTPTGPAELSDSIDPRPSSSMGRTSTSEWLSSGADALHGSAQQSGDTTTNNQVNFKQQTGKLSETNNSSETNRNQNNKRLHADQQRRPVQQQQPTSRIGDHGGHHRHHRGHKHSHDHASEHHHRHHHHHHHRHHPRRHHSHNRKSPRLSTSIPPTENLINMQGDSNNIVLEVDDNEDADIIALLIDSDIPDGFLICNGETMPTINQQSIESINMFTQVIRVKLTGLDQFAQQFDWVLQALMVKQRRSLPCCLTNLNFVVDLPEAHVVQITVTGSLLGLKSASSSPSSLSSSSTASSSSAPSASSSSMNLAALEAGDKLTSSAAGGDGGGVKQQQHKKRLGQQKKNEGKSLSTAGRSATKSEDKKKSSRPIAASSTSMSPTSLSPSSNNNSDLNNISPSSSESGGIEMGDGNRRASSPSSSSTTTSSASSDDDNSSRSSGSSSESKKKDKSKPKPKPATVAAAATVPIKVSDSNNDEPKQSLVKQFSKGNLAALINAGKSTFSDRKFRSSASKSTDKIELTETPSQAIAMSRINQQQQQRQQERSARLLRTVFKKQQTYPGAISPPISGHENLFDKLSSMSRKKDLAPRLSPVPRNSSGGVMSKQQMAAATAAIRLPSTSSARLHHLQTGAHSNTTDDPSLVVELADAEQTKFSQGHQAHHRRQHGHHQYRPTGQMVVGQKRHRGGHGSSLNSSIDITSLSYIPGAKEYHYLGNLTFSFVRETNSVRENGGLNGFIHCFLMEVYAIVRAHVSALGGNAFLSFRLQQSCIFYHSNKNQAQCLISVAGDAVQVAV